MEEPEHSERVPPRGVFARSAPREERGPLRAHLFSLRLRSTGFEESLFTVTEGAENAGAPVQVRAQAHAAAFERALDEAAGEPLEDAPYEPPSPAVLRVAEEYAGAQAEALAAQAYGPLARALEEAARALRDEPERWEARRDALLRAHRAHATATLLASVELRAENP